MYPGSELTFVNVQNPHDVVEPSLRHRIRSRAAFHTHECRQKSTLPLQLSQSVGQFNVLVPRYTSRKEASSSGQSNLERKRLRSASTVGQDEIDAAVRRDALESRLSTTFAYAPVPHERWHAELLDVWNNDLYPKYWELTNIERMTGIKYRDYQPWMQRASMTDPTLYYVELLAGLRNAYPNAGQGVRRRILIEAELCREFNNALDDPEHRLSTTTLISVARIAFHEFHSGSRETAFRIHFPGLQRMLDMKGGVQGFRKDALHMVVELFRLHAWMVVEIGELKNEQSTPPSEDLVKPASDDDGAGGGSHAEVDSCVKQEEPRAEAAQRSYSYGCNDIQIIPAVSDSSDRFLRQIAWRPCEAKLHQEIQPCGETLLSFWTTTCTVRDYPADFAVGCRLDAVSQGADWLAPGT